MTVRQKSSSANSTQPSSSSKGVAAMVLEVATRETRAIRDAASGSVFSGRRGGGVATNEEPRSILEKR